MILQVQPQLPQYQHLESGNVLILSKVRTSQKRAFKLIIWPLLNIFFPIACVRREEFFINEAKKEKLEEASPFSFFNTLKKPVWSNLNLFVEEKGKKRRFGVVFMCACIFNKWDKIIYVNI